MASRENPQRDLRQDKLSNRICVYTTIQQTTEHCQSSRSARGAWPPVYVLFPRSDVHPCLRPCPRQSPSNCAQRARCMYAYMYVFMFCHAFILACVIMLTHSPTQARTNARAHTHAQTYMSKYTHTCKCPPPHTHTPGHIQADNRTCNNLRRRPPGCASGSRP